jgi:hypothetical protein
MKATTNTRSKRSLWVYLRENFLWILWGFTTFYALVAFTSYTIDAEGQLHHACTHWTTGPVALTAGIGLILLIIKHLRAVSLLKSRVETLESYKETHKLISEATLEEAHERIMALLMRPMDFVEKGWTLKQAHNELMHMADKAIKTQNESIEAMRKDAGLPESDIPFQDLLMAYLVWAARMIENEGRIKERLTREEERNRELVQSVREQQRIDEVCKREIKTLENELLQSDLEIASTLHNLRPVGNLGKMNESELRSLLKSDMLPTIARERIAFARLLIDHMRRFRVKRLGDLPSGDISTEHLRALLKEAVQDAFQAHKLISADGAVVHPCAHELIGLCLMDPRDPTDAP